MNSSQTRDYGDRKEDMVPKKRQDSFETNNHLPIKEAFKEKSQEIL